MQAFAIFRFKLKPALRKDSDAESAPVMLFLIMRQKRRILLIGLKEVQELSTIRQRVITAYPELSEVKKEDLNGAIRDILDDCNVYYLNDVAHHSMGS
jgi:hypothetical protein